MIEYSIIGTFFLGTMYGSNYLLDPKYKLHMCILGFVSGMLYTDIKNYIYKKSKNIKYQPQYRNYEATNNIYKTKCKAISNEYSNEYSDKIPIEIINEDNWN